MSQSSQIAKLNEQERVIIDKVDGVFDSKDDNTTKINHILKFHSQKNVTEESRLVISFYLAILYHRVLDKTKADKYFQKTEKLFLKRLRQMEQLINKPNTEIYKALANYIGKYIYLLREFQAYNSLITLEKKWLKVFEKIYNTGYPPPSLPDIIVQSLSTDKEEREKDKDHFKRIEETVGFDREFNKTLFEVVRIAPHPINVLVEGESGTGKEVIARLIHLYSPRRKEKFISVNCAAFPENLIESELFGHEKGAFSGAITQRIGALELADKGTLFLDEIDKLSLKAQGSLLRVIEYEKFCRVGSNEERETRIKYVFATNKSLIENIKDGSFLPDLYHRMLEYRIKLTPLKERDKGDIGALAYFWYSTFMEELFHEKIDWEKDNREPFTDKALYRLERYSWPGNIRELRNVIRRAVIKSNGGLIKPKHIEFYTEDLIHKNGPSSFPLEEAEKDHIIKALKHFGWNKSETARKLGIHYTTLLRKVKRYNISQDEYGNSL